MAKYYENSDTSQRFQPGTTVRADEVDGKFDQVATGFSDAEDDVARSLKLAADGSNHEVSANATERRNKVVGFDPNGDMALVDGFAWRGDYASSTDYFVNDVFRDPTTKDLYVVEVRHTSTSTIDTAKTDLAINVSDVEAAKDAAKASEDEAEAWASKTDGQVEATGYSAKAYATGGQGVDGSIGSAKDWATKTDGTVDGTLYSAKYWATDENVAIVSGNIGPIKTVAGIDSEIGYISSNSAVVDAIGSDLSGGVFSHDLGLITNATEAQSSVSGGYIVTVYDIRDDVQTVAGIASSVSDVAVIQADVQTVSGVNSEVAMVASRASEVSTVADYVGTGQDITVVAREMSDVNTVAGLIADVSSVSAIAADVATVSGISADVVTLNDNETNVNMVAGSITDVRSVSAINSEVTSITDNLTQIQAVSSDLAGAAFGPDLGSITETATAPDGVPNGYLTTVYNNRYDIQAVADNLGDINELVDALNEPLSTASGVGYDDSVSGLSVSDVQAAIDELESLKASLSGGNNFSGNQQITGDLTVDGKIDCGTLA